MVEEFVFVKSVSREFGVTESLIRYWWEQGKIPAPRNYGGRKLCFTAADVEKIREYNELRLKLKGIGR